jgi:signal transduction histidine kinase
MKPEFALLLIFYGTLSLVFLLFSAKWFMNSNGNLLTYLKASTSFFAFSVSILAFIQVTAPTKSIYNALDFMKGTFALITSVFIILTMVFYMKYKQNHKKDFLLFDSLLYMIDDFVFIFDANGEIALQNNPKNEEPLFFKPITTIEDVAKALNNSNFHNILHQNMIFEEKIENRFFAISSSVITNTENIFLGAVVIFYNITKEKKLIEELENKNNQISNANTQILQEIKVDEELLSQKERERFSFEIQSKLGLKMDIVLAQISEMQAEKDANGDKKEQNLKLLAKNLREVLADIRNFVYQSKR